MTPSELLELHRSDKVSAHSYGPLYDKLFPPFQYYALNVLEIGILHGCSLRAWRDYFKNATIIGIDNHPSRLITDIRIESRHVDTTDRDRFMEVCGELPQFEIIIDDGSHVFNEQLFALAVLWPKLRPGGIYIVEDIPDIKYLELFACFPNATLHDLREVKGQQDDLVAVMRK